MRGLQQVQLLPLACNVCAIFAPGSAGDDAFLTKRMARFDSVWGDGVSVNSLPGDQAACFLNMLQHASTCFDRSTRSGEVGAPWRNRQRGPLLTGRLKVRVLLEQPLWSCSVLVVHTRLSIWRCGFDSRQDRCAVVAQSARASACHVEVWECKRGLRPTNLPNRTQCVEGAARGGQLAC